MSWDAGLREDLKPWFKWIVAFIAFYDPRAQVTSGYRSTTEQAKLYRRFQAGLMPGPVAPPGRSLHEQGRAIDVLATDDALSRAGAAWRAVGGTWGGGFTSVDPDPIHFEA